MDIATESVDDVDTSIEFEHMKKVEAALFIAGRYLSISELVALTDINPLLLKKILADLSEKYKERGIEIINKNNLWKMDVVGEYLSMVNKLATGNSEFGKAEQETLAILAYKQPVKQSVIINIRGNKAYDHIKRFVEMGLVNKKRMGHTAELSLNDTFYEYFSLGGETEEHLPSLLSPVDDSKTKSESSQGAV